MNPEFKVLTNVGETNLRTPIIQNRFRKLTLQSPHQSNIPPKMPEHTAVPPSKLATEKIINRPKTPIITDTRSQSQTITNKLMLSTSSNALTETNFINVETEPFTSPLRVESTENAEKTPKNSGNGQLALQMEKIEESRVSAELFSQYSSSSKISLPPNRVLSNKENIDNLSQRMSNIELAETQPNTTSPQKRRSCSTLADTQPNTAPHRKQQLEQSVVESIVLSSDDEDSNADRNNMRNNSLLTEESNDGSVIEIVSSDDDSIHASDNRIRSNRSALNAEIDELTESVAQKLNNFFDNIPKLDQPGQNVYKSMESSAPTKDKSDTSVNIPETEPSDGDGNCDDDDNVLVLEASQLDESGKVSGDKATSDVYSMNENEGDEKNENQNSLSDNPDDDSIHSSRHQSPVLRKSESSKTSTVDNESENRSVDGDSDNAESILPNQSTDEKQLSVREPKRKVEFKKIKKDATKVITLNSPQISISATVNINIQVSGFSSTSSDTDATSENADDPSQQSSKDNSSLQSEDIIDSSMEVVSRNNARQRFGFNSKNFIVCSPNNKASDHELPSQDQSPQSSAIESAMTNSQEGTTVDDRNGDQSPDSSMIESSMTKSLEGTTVDDRNGDQDASVTFESNSSMGKESANTSASSADIEAKESTDASTTSADLLTKESADTSTSSANIEAKESDGTLSVTPTDTSVEIDEIGEQLLNGIYGDTWRTPQLIKKCVSTRKKCQTDVINRAKSRGFSLFSYDIIQSELDSTRITPRSVPMKDHSDESQPDSDLTIPNKDKEVIGRDADQSSRIIRTRRKVAPNRVLDFSDDDGDDNDQSVQSLNSAFEPESSEESDSSVEILEKPEPPRRKRNKFVFLDLTCNEVVEDEDHENPDATTEELKKVVETYLQSLQTKKNVATPAPVKENVPSINTKRKLFTPNYDDQIPFEEIKTPEPVNRDSEPRTIQLKTPIPSYLIPPQFRDKAKIVTEPITPRTAKDSKMFPAPFTPAPKTACGFLESLDDKLIPEQHCDPEALKYRTNFKRHRNELVKRLMSIYNNYVFDNKLKDVPVSWNNNLKTTAGICRLRKRAGVRIAFVELSEKVLTSADRLRDTLIHELCHAASWLIDRDSGNHGKIWKYWTNRANKRFPELPVIKRCHNYELECKYTYKCTICGLKSKARSKSKKVENIRCAACHGPIEVFLNKTDKDGQVVLVPSKEPSMFAKFVKEKYKLHKVSGATHADVMKILGNNFGKLTVEEKLKYKQ